MKTILALIVGFVLFVAAPAFAGDRVFINSAGQRVVVRDRLFRADVVKVVNPASVVVGDAFIGRSHGATILFSPFGAPIAVRSVNPLFFFPVTGFNHVGGFNPFNNSVIVLDSRVRCR